MSNDRDSEEWFTESETLWPGQRFSLKVEEVLFKQRSNFQDVVVFKSSTYGNVLVLDGVIQATERDEFAYQEMIAHIPLFAHAEPKKVLIVGGGDGGVLREVVKHACVEKVVMCEIDPMVCEVSKKFFKSSLATAFDDERFTMVHADASKYLVNENTEKFDVIIVDSSDPVGPAEALYQSSFYKNMRDALSPNGIICTQGECLWLHLDLIKKVMESCGSLFSTVQYAYTTIPSYPSACHVIENVLQEPKRMPDQEMMQSLRYYSTPIHKAAFVLPTFAEREIRQVCKN